MCLVGAGASSGAARLCSELGELGAVMPKALVVLGLSSFLVVTSESTARQQELWLLRELQAESNFLCKEKAMKCTLSQLQMT